MAERQFGPYRLVRQIAVGGMAEIHLAKTRGIAGFEKYVALKMIHPNFASDEQFIEMLIDEAKIAVQLQHVNIAQTFDLGRVGETYNVRYNPDHRWYYVPQLRTDEALLIKCFDSKTDGRARFVAHTAFADPTTPPNTPPRESIELRTLVFHPE